MPAAREQASHKAHPSTITAEVRDRLRRDIVSGVLSPGSRLKVSELTSSYRISGAPIREALGQLQGEGLVVILPNRGASVRAVDAQLIHNIYDVREAIESFLIARFAELASDTDISAIEAIQSRFEDAAANRDNTSMQAANQEFHAYINGAYRNAEALEVLRRSSQLVAHLRHKFGYSDFRLTQIIEEHRAIIAALRERDAVKAAAAVALHDRSARAELVRQLGLSQGRSGSAASPTP